MMLGENVGSFLNFVIEFSTKVCLFRLVPWKFHNVMF